MRIEIFDAQFDPWIELSRYQQSLPQGKFGATCAFVGSMRDFNEDSSVSAMDLEHYAGMTEQHLEEICRQAIDDYALDDALVIHRIGKILPGNPIVLVAVWSAHRAEAIGGCETIVEYLKSKAPFWKKEALTDGSSRWVEHNTAGRSDPR